MINKNKWQPMKTAPLDATQVLLSGVMPWPVMAAWNNIHKKWGCCILQVEPVRGVWEDSYFENDYHEMDSKKMMWMPLPDSPEKVETQDSTDDLEYIKIRLAQIASGDYRACGHAAEAVAQDALDSLNKIMAGS